MSEQELIERAKSHDKKAMEELYNAHVDKLYRYIYSNICDSAAAEELTSTIFAKVLMNLPQFRGDAAFSTWMYSITRNELYKYYTEKKVAADIYIPFEEEELAVGAEDEVIDISVKEADELEIKREQDAKSKVNLLFAKLPAQYSEVLRLKYLMQLTFSEIANTLNITKNYAKVLHNRAIKKANKLFQ